jgi:hypothetical protein
MSIQGAARADRLNSIEIGDHILAIYQDKESEFNEAFQYLKDGLEKDETVMIITDRLSHDEIPGGLLLCSIRFLHKIFSSV